MLSRHTIPLDTSCENIKQQAIVSTHFPHIAPVKTVHAQTWQLLSSTSAGNNKLTKDFEYVDADFSKYENLYCVKTYKYMTIMINWCADVRACLCSYSCTAPASFVSFHMHYCIHVWSDVATAGKAPTNKTLLDSPRDALNKIDHTKNTREKADVPLSRLGGGAFWEDLRG